MNQPNNKKPEPLSFDSESKDLNWLAFCYIADELDQTERMAFESRLLECEDAREAVVDAVRDSQTLYGTLQSESQPLAHGVNLAAPKQATHTLRWTATLVATAAAVLLAVNSWSFIFPPNTPNTPVVAADSDGLAAAWVETLITMSDAELDEFINEEFPQTEVVTDELDDWMFVALSEADSKEGVEGEAH
ncbi:hypothetical protein N9B09_01380 [bacterium]|nr:hypothetical protein [bacterium]MDA7880211.1 hypothetical protein [Mariniblastus sp.]